MAFFIIKCLMDTDFLTLLFAFIKFWFLKSEDVTIHALSIMCVYVCTLTTVKFANSSR